MSEKPVREEDVVKLLKEILEDLKKHLVMTDKEDAKKLRITCRDADGTLVLSLARDKVMTWKEFDNGEIGNVTEHDWQSAIESISNPQSIIRVIMLGCHV